RSALDRRGLLRIGDRDDEKAVHLLHARREAAQEGVAAVAAEDLVAAVAGQRHFYFPRSLAREQMQRHVRWAGKRRVTARDQLRQLRQHVAPLEHDLMVLRAEVLGEARGGGKLASLVVGESGREGGDVFAVALHQRDDRRRVVAAGEQRTDRLG